MSEIEKLLRDAVIPSFYCTHFDVCQDEVGDAATALTDALRGTGVLARIRPGETVAITAGSREISHLPEMLRALIGALKARGAQPFIVPAMGSHGGATAEGQETLLAGFGITEASMGVPIRSSMQTILIAETPTGIPVHMDKWALSADCIIPVGRIKPHTDFKGRFESGLMKMLAIGLGKQHGASICHKLGMPDMSQNVLAIGREILQRCRIPFSIGIIENAFHGTWKVAAIPGERIEEEEPKLLEEAKKLVPVVPFDKVDIIVCEEMGKDLSGTGMDSNVIGRSASLGISRPYAERIGVFALTEKSHGNANGMGLADCITKRFHDRIRFDQTYPNAITSAETTAVKMPAVMDTDEECVRFLIKTCTGSGPSGLRMVWIKNTLAMDRFFISEGLKDDATTPGLCVEPEAYRAGFDAAGWFTGFCREE